MRALLIVIVLTAMQADGKSLTDKELATLNTDIRHVWSGGSWKDIGQEGFYRILVTGGGYEHYKTKLYIQWVTNGFDDTLPKVIATTGIKQLNDDSLYAFGIPICIGGWECNSIELDATHTYNQNNHKFKVVLTGIGSYKFVDSAVEKREPSKATNSIPPALSTWVSNQENVGYEKKDQCDKDKAKFHNPSLSSVDWIVVLVCYDYQVHEPYPSFAFYSEKENKLGSVNMNNEEYWKYWQKTNAPQVASITDVDNDGNIEIKLHTEPYEGTESGEYIVEWVDGKLVKFD